MKHINHPSFSEFASAGIYIFVPIGYIDPAATVCHADARTQELVIPFVLPVHFAHEQYADVFIVTTVGVILLISDESIAVLPLPYLVATFEEI